MVKDPYRNVRGHVGIPGSVLGHSLPIGRKPAAVFILVAHHPIKRRPGFRQIPAGAQSHGGFNVIPGIGFLAFTPRNLTA